MATNDGAAAAADDGKPGADDNPGVGAGLDIRAPRQAEGDEKSAENAGKDGPDAAADAGAEKPGSADKYDPAVFKDLMAPLPADLPEGFKVPDAFKGPDGELRLGALLKSNADQQAALRAKTPEAPETYALPDGVEVADGDRLHTAFEATAKDVGLSQDQYGKVTAMWFQAQADYFAAEKADIEAHYGDKYAGTARALEAYYGGKLGEWAESGKLDANELERAEIAISAMTSNLGGMRLLDLLRGDSAGAMPGAGDDAVNADPEMTDEKAFEMKKALGPNPTNAERAAVTAAYEQAAANKQKRAKAA